jgi:hypothetical protein
MQQWNLSLERQLTSTLVVRGSYVGTRGNHLYIALDENVAFPRPGTVALNRPYPQYAGISAWEPVGISAYHAMEWFVEKRFSSNLFFTAGYTWSRALDMGGGGNSASAEGRNNVQNPRNIRAEYGLADFNYGQRVTVSGVYNLPVGRGKQYLGSANGVVDAVVGGWQLTSIFAAQTGPPGSLSMATATSNTGSSQRPNRVCDGNLPADQRTVRHWYDTSCFVAPPNFTFGNTGRNIITAPGYASWDFGAHKDFRLTEKTGLTFRAEFFNFLNKANFGYPGSSIGSATAGVISSVGPARQIQFALRLHF